MKKRYLKKTLFVLLSLAIVYGLVLFVGCGGGGSSSSTPPPAATNTTYTGTLYMASEGGGHIAIVPVTIDPSNTTSPITVGTVSIKQLSGTPGNAPNHIFHDVRYDGANNRVYYSAIISEATNSTVAHMGYIDLANNNAVNDATIDVDSAAAAKTGSVIGLPLVYCASGIASKVSGTDYYAALSMTMPAYIDVLPKSAIVSAATLTTARKRTYVESFRAGGDPNYLFAHGAASPDGSKLYVAVNELSSGAPVGSVTGYLVKTSDLASGSTTTASATASYTITGMKNAAGTVAFRASFTPDGTKILQAGKDRFLVLDAATLHPLNGSTGDTTIGGTKTKIENHDAMPTPDGKYAILMLRYVDTDTSGKLTSGLQLYDLTTMKPIGGPSVTCTSCHASAGTSTTMDHGSCGVDGKLTAH